MKTSVAPLSALAVLASLLFAGCQGPSLSDRIEADRGAYESWSAEVRQSVAEGRIAVGFTTEQVRMAWGEPDHIATEISAAGELDQWIYQKRRSGLSIGLGVGSYGRSGGVGGGIGTTIGGHTDVIAVARFKDGVVASFERMDKPAGKS